VGEEEGGLEDGEAKNNFFPLRGPVLCRKTCEENRALSELEEIVANSGQFLSEKKANFSFWPMLASISTFLP